MSNHKSCKSIVLSTRYPKEIAHKLMGKQRGERNAFIVNAVTEALEVAEIETADAPNETGASAVFSNRIVQ